MPVKEPLYIVLLQVFKEGKWLYIKYYNEKKYGIQEAYPDKILDRPVMADPLIE